MLLQRLAHLVALAVADAPRDAARAGVVRHQDDEPAGEADEGRQRGALGAAFFLLDLDDDFLAFAQDLADVDPAVGTRLVDEVLGGDFLQWQEAVAVGAVLDEGRVEAGLDPRDPAFVDVGFLLFPGLALDI